MVRPWGHYTEQSTSEMKRQILCDLMYVESKNQTGRNRNYDGHQRWGVREKGETGQRV